MTYAGQDDIDRSKSHPTRRLALTVSRFVSFLVYLYVVAVEILLTLGFVLLLLGANPSSGFVEWVYRSMDRAMRPFRGIFAPIDIGTAGNNVPSVFETSVLFAMIVYAILALVLHALIEWLNSRLSRLDYEDELYRREQVALKASASAPAPLEFTGEQTSQPQNPPTQ